jgi:tetratricopeptide (TPR) repeat protein
VDPADLERLAAKVSDLAKLEEVKDALELEDELAEERIGYMGRFSRFLLRFEAGDELWTVRDVVRELRIAELQKESEDVSHPREARAAQRLLEYLFVTTSFYLPRQYLEEKEPTHALSMLEVAERIRPGSFGSLVFFARAYAQKGDEKKAIESLRKACEIRPLTQEFLLGDPYFDPIREEPGFKELFQSLK